MTGQTFVRLDFPAEEFPPRLRWVSVVDPHLYRSPAAEFGGPEHRHWRNLQGRDRFVLIRCRDDREQ
jgi:hypothetical protein